MIFGFFLAKVTQARAFRVTNLVFVKEKVSIIIKRNNHKKFASVFINYKRERVEI